jgi:hypothetical protein
MLTRYISSCTLASHQTDHQHCLQHTAQRHTCNVSPAAAACTLQRRVTSPVNRFPGGTSQQQQLCALQRAQGCSLMQGCATAAASCCRVCPCLQQRLEQRCSGGHRSCCTLILCSVLGRCQQVRCCCAVPPVLVVSELPEVPAAEQR